MKIYLDDERPTPEGWTRVENMWDARKIINEHWDEITDISLDHDLGDEEIVGNGYKVICWIEKEVCWNERPHNFNLYVHTANSSARMKMEQAKKNIDARRKV